MSKPSPARYRTTNWSSYNDALRRRGSLLVWFDREMVWLAPRDGRHGRPPVFSNAAIQFCLSIKVLFRLPLRQAAGMVASLLQMAGLDWPVPDYSTLCRRQKSLTVRIPYRRAEGPLNLLVDSSRLPADAIATLKVLVAALTHLEREIGRLDAEIARRAKENEVARRLMTVPGIGPLIATALAVLAPPPGTFRKARDFAAWLGLTPRQHSTGGKQRLGATTKMGERSLRRLLILGANSVIIKRHVHATARPGTWLAGMLMRKPPLLVRVALANKMARIVWALMARGGVYQSPAAAA